jgi:putative inorganic carbon (HCO3(-)) transporter
MGAGESRAIIMSVPLATRRGKLPIALAMLRSSRTIALAMALALWLTLGDTGSLRGFAGWGGFALLALLRPDLGLLCVPATLPMFVLAVVQPYDFGPGAAWPLHELVLLVVLAATLLRGGHALLPLLRRAPVARPILAMRGWRPCWREILPVALFMGAGVFGVLIALPDAEAHGAAVREFRRFFVEPVLFYVLLRWQIARDPRYTYRLTATLAWTGALVALLALVQYVGFEHVVELLFSQRPDFADSVSQAGDVRRTSSVYGNPNNLGLFLGRVWPLAAALAFAARASDRRRAILFGACAALCLAGIVVSFSRGAWLGVAGALMILAVALAGRRTSAPIMRGTLVIVGGMLALALGTVLALRGIVGASDEVRLLFWREAWQLIQRHPFGLGLDQFYYYHNPAFGRSLIDPALAQTSDRFAHQPHNLLLEWWLQAGPLGVAAFGWLLARFFQHARAIRRHAPAGEWGLLAPGAAAAMTAALLHGLVDSFYGWPDIVFLFWLLLALVKGAYHQITGNVDELPVTADHAEPAPQTDAATETIPTG